MPSAVNSYQRFLEAAHLAGLHYRELESGKRAQVQTPGHSDQDRGTSITYNGDQLLVYCHNGNTDNVLDSLGLSLSDLYDEPSGPCYEYGDGRLVHRSPEKHFSQSGNTKGTNLYGLPSLSQPGPVYVVEGEKDVNTAINVWGVAAVSQAQGANTGPDKADWSPLKGRDVVIVADDDKPGEKRANKVFTYLTGLAARPESVRIVKATAGKDLSDHIAAGHTSDDLVAVGEKVGRRRVKLVKASSVKTEKVNWLIPEWIPANMLTLLAGREGIGKSTIACGWVAEFSSRGMKCAYLNSEDSRSFTVRPRLQAAGANLDNIFFIDVETETGSEGHLRLPQDTDILFRELVDQDVKFVVLDAAKSSMDPKLDGYKDDHVRQFLEPLAAAADKYNITIVGLAHFGKKEGKDTGRLLLGSIAWSQIARSVLSAAVDDGGRLIVTNTKGNLARGIVSREATIVSRPVQLDDGTLTELGAIEWGEFTDTPATDLLESQDDGEQDDRTDAEVWLQDYLTERGPTPRSEVLKAAKKADVASERTIKRAFKNLGGESHSAGFPRVATWSLPSRDSRANVSLGVNNRGPTGPTGDMQAKHDGPTGQKLQSGHGPHTGPTGQLFTLNAPSIGAIDSHAREQESMESMREPMGVNASSTLQSNDSSTPQSNDLEVAVLNALDTTRGQTTKQIQKHLTKQQLDQADDFYTVIERLQMKGLIRINERGLFVRKETA